MRLSKASQELRIRAITNLLDFVTSARRATVIRGDMLQRVAREVVQAGSGFGARVRRFRLRSAEARGENTGGGWTLKNSTGGGFYVCRTELNQVVGCAAYWRQILFESALALVEQSETVPVCYVTEGTCGSCESVLRAGERETLPTFEILRIDPESCRRRRRYEQVPVDQWGVWALEERFCRRKMCRSVARSYGSTPTGAGDQKPLFYFDTLPTSDGLECMAVPDMFEPEKKQDTRDLRRLSIDYEDA